LIDLLKKGVAVMALRGSGAVVSFLAMLVLSRSLGSDGFGVYSYLIILLTLCTIPVSYGWGVMNLRTTSQGLRHANWQQSRGMGIRGSHYALLVSLLIAAAYLLVNFLDADLLTNRISLSAAISLIAVLYLFQLSALRTSTLRGLDFPVWAQIPELVLRPIFLIMSLAILAFGLGQTLTLNITIYSLLIASLLAFLLGWYFLKRLAPAGYFREKPTFDDHTWLMSALPIMASSGLVVLNSYMDTLILGYFTSASEVGFYRIAAQVAILSGLAYTSLNMLANQRFAFLRSSDTMIETQNSATQFARLGLLGSAFVPIVLLLGGGTLVTLLFGIEYLPALTPMVILAFGQCINAAFGMPQALLIMHGREKRIARYALIALVTNFILSILLIPSLLIVGAAIANVATLSLLVFLQWNAARTELGVDTSIFGGLFVPGSTSMR